MIVQFLATLLFWCCCALFTLKLLWNMSVPYSLAFEPMVDGKRTRGISLMPYLEVALLVVAVALAALFGDTVAGAGPLDMALIGAGAIVATYVHLFVAGAILAWFTRNRTLGRKP